MVGMVEYVTKVFAHIHPTLEVFAQSVGGTITELDYIPPVLDIKWLPPDELSLSDALQRDIYVEVTQYYPRHDHLVAEVLARGKGVKTGDNILSIAVGAVWYASVVRQPWYNHENGVEMVPLPSDLSELNLEQLVKALTNAKDKVSAWTKDDLRMTD